MLSTLPYQVSAYDPLTPGIVVALLLSAAAAACSAPALRAASIDPVRSLRSD